MERNLKLFEDKNEDNTDECFELVRKRVNSLDIENVVVATTSGETGARAAEFFEEDNIDLVVVSHQYGYKEDGKVELEDEYKESIENHENCSLVFTPDVLTRVPKIVRGKYNSFSHLDLISDTLRMISQGAKVCVECTIQAADSGNIPVNEEICAIAGTVNGADTGVILKSQHSQNLFDIDFKEIICMPRNG